MSANPSGPVEAEVHEYPPTAELAAVLRSLIPSIDDDCRASMEDEEPSMMVTFGFTPSTGAWNYQTGDNSFTGGAYGHPDWACITLTRESDCDQLAEEIHKLWEDCRW